MAALRGVLCNRRTRPRSREILAENAADRPSFRNRVRDSRPGGPRWPATRSTLELGLQALQQAQGLEPGQPVQVQPAQGLEHLRARARFGRALAKQR